ncbi:CDGSH iron-sulfur domain-containing protein [Streptomyces lydicus]|uniref:CDGSH iron-sulfur domain-containing protein n=1 Tax=Streptomyces lydicus TaxID=47763 RepID=UPI0036EB5C8D
MPSTPERPRRITLTPDGPLLVEGPVEVIGADGTVVVSRRFVVALCTCRRSRSYPWCDTSHRRRSPPGGRAAGPARCPAADRAPEGADGVAEGADSGAGGVGRAPEGEDR